MSLHPVQAPGTSVLGEPLRLHRALRVRQGSRHHPPTFCREGLWVLLSQTTVAPIRPKPKHRILGESLIISIQIFEPGAKHACVFKSLFQKLKHSINGVDTSYVLDVTLPQASSSAGRSSGMAAGFLLHRHLLHMLSKSHKVLPRMGSA